MDHFCGHNPEHPERSTHKLVDDLTAEDFRKLGEAMRARWKPYTCKVAIGAVKTLFKWGRDNGLCKEPPLTSLKKPSALEIRRSQNGSGRKMYEPEEVRKLLANADANMRAMVLLAAQSGCGNADLTALPLAAIDLESGWVGSW